MRYKFYTSCIDTAVASDRLRTKPAISAQNSIIKERSLVSLLDMTTESIKEFARLILLRPKSKNYKIIKLFSKPYSNGDFLYLILSSVLSPTFPLIIDICDLPNQTSTALVPMGNKFLGLLLKLSTITTASTNEIASEIYKRFSIRPLVISDCIDIEAFPTFNVKALKSAKSNHLSLRLLWFGNSGALDSSGKIIPSDSFKEFSETIFRLEISNEFRSIMRTYELEVCTNNTAAVKHLFKPIIDAGQRFRFSPWSSETMKTCLSRASVILLTYGSNPSSSWKSPNRIQLAMSAMVPVVVVNEPPSIHPFLACFESLDSFDLSLLPDYDEFKCWLRSRSIVKSHSLEQDGASYRECCKQFNGDVLEKWRSLRNMV
jgi:hypothetical protein